MHAFSNAKSRIFLTSFCRKFSIGMMQRYVLSNLIHFSGKFRKSFDNWMRRFSLRSASIPSRNGFRKFELNFNRRFHFVNHLLTWFPVPRRKISSSCAFSATRVLAKLGPRLAADLTRKIRAPIKFDIFQPNDQTLEGSLSSVSRTICASNYSLFEAFFEIYKIYAILAIWSGA